MGGVSLIGHLPIYATAVLATTDQGDTPWVAIRAAAGRYGGWAGRGDGS